MKKFNKYKDSGIEWIGEIPEHWEMWKISHSFKRIGSGTTPESGNPLYHKNGTINWLNTGDLNDGIIYSCNKKITIKALENYSSLKLFPAGSLVMAMYGATIGKTSIINFDTTTNQACCVFCEDEIIDVKFLQYWFIGNKEHIINLAIGGGQPNISQNILKDVRVSCPIFQEQTTIANYLDHKTTQIDTLIAKKEQFISLLQEERTAVINQAVTKGLDPKVKMKDSGIEWLGEIPEHWEVKRLKYCFQIFGGFAFSSSDFTTEGVQIVKIGNLYQNQLCLDRAPTYVKTDFIESHPDFLAKKGDILMSLTGTLGKRDYGYAILIQNDDELMVNQRVALIKANEGMSIEFSINMFHCELYLNQLYKIPTGTKQGNLSCDDVLSISMAIPPKNEQLKIGEYLKFKSKEINSIISKAEQEIDLLKEYKTALISEVVTGKVDVTEEILN